MLQLIVHDAIDGFLRAAEYDLAQDEVTNGLMLGVTLRVKQHPERVEHQPYLATVHADGALLAAGVMTPPHGLIAYAATDDPQPAMRLLAENLVANRWPLPTVNGVATLSRTFAEAWRRLTGGEVTQEMALRVFELRTVTPPVGVAGQFRQAAIEDADLIFAWYTAFYAEATPAQTLPRQPDVERSLAEGNIYLWEDGGRPTSLAAKGRRTPRGISVGPVYTPPEARGRGYASACVAALSQHILGEGKAFCTLFTDLANPTSNSIYQKIGYHPVCDFTEYRLRQPLQG
jgi:predicted GNAT family acetyltransferase